MELKTAIVTGGSRGIGAAITKKFAASGIQVAVIYAGNEAAAQAVCEHCQTTYGVKAVAYRCDVSNFEETRAVVAAIKAEFGGVDILVNNAGITRDGLIARMKEDDFDAVMNTNLKGAFHMIRQCSPIFIRNKGGRIVNISSVVGISGNAGQANYAASKAGIIGLTKSVAKELASRGVTCNAVAPGFIDTDMTKNLDESGEVLAQIPLGRVGTPEDVAQTVAFLTQASYITGEVIRVDGGMAI
ncbi:MAG: 3-oxoacyl-[acyl-carrier-protein] reductase [Evtepia sp.]